MAKATVKEVPASDSEEEEPRSAKKSTSASRNASANKGQASDAVAAEEDDGSGSDGEEEEEYEIEAILDAKHGTFPGGRVGYLVKWKGYGEEHNSWVDEKDAIGAKELIDEYWKKVGKKRKSDAKPKPAAKPPKSKEESDEEPAQPAKKRGRPSKGQTKPVDEDQDEDMEDEAPKKKPRKSTGGASAKGTKRGAAAAGELDEESTYADMSKWKDLATWEHLVQSIDTVERTENNTLLVYFTLKNGKGQGRETSDVCKKKIPYKLIEFYESNLRWKQTDEDAMEE
ncbi:hypothetical protein BD309DRAFT_468378 [Dichomitus squalens]|uniref:Uncharacterized protein n=1 Tax=Dichomitus squalens TaxID=114155 RepID=A0A4Q9P031_9APHY|nr:hypothetical protein BD309DRAFT_468378 [Dichomitus squalens]TBU60596.1 hypothetical protein BD310DRAFT_324187 [Dichomitus squalens]